MDEYSAADETKVTEEKKRLDILRAQQLDDLRTIVSTPQGMRFFQRMLIDSGYFIPRKLAGDEIQYHQGARNFLSVYVCDLIQAAPMTLPQILYAHTGG